MATRLISVLRLSLVCTALSWPRLGGRDSTNAPRGKPDPELFGAEVSGLLANYAVLQDYSHRPDCFREVAGKIERRCGTLEMDNDARVEAAISMTLCELATAAHYSPPLECASFAMDGRSPGECVDALSRRPQFWSSYSGYLREVPQLCFAFRRWNDIDTARDIYRNATIEITNLVRAITAREKADLTGKKLWDIQLSELANVASRLKIAFDMMDVLISGVTPRFKHELTRIVKEFKADLQEAQTRKQSHTADQIGSDLQLILKEHAHSLDNLAPLLEKFLADNLNDAISSFQTQSLPAYTCSPVISRPAPAGGRTFSAISSSLLTSRLTKLDEPFGRPRCLVGGGAASLSTSESEERARFFPLSF
ncbi:hypothetical protein B0H14DRAFT_2929942 [Mycena olivaceomarginata]|nr:hypothetical protein B0H14DRAFT_2929942 [Mycena olivaceomarginata]